MDHDKLVQMANRIGQFFAAMPDRDEALEGIAHHLRSFWEPRMRRQLYARLDEGGQAAEPAAWVLHPLVEEAVRRFRDQLEPVAAG